MPRTFYTVDDLYKFCKENNFSKFSSKEHDNKPLIVQSIESFESNDTSKDGLLDVKLKACHIGVNRNGSSISEDTMKQYMDSFKGRPILGSIFKADNGEYEFHSHDIDIDEDGNLEYIEQPVGVISQLKEPYLEYDEKNDKTYLMVEGHVFEDYSKAAEILQRHKTCKCSVEIAVDEMSWNAEENYLSIDKFGFRGVTILGYEQDGKTPIEEGMQGSKITIEDFGEKNSMFSQNYQEKLIDALEKLNNTLSTFQNKDFNQKGVNEEMNKLETLMEEYKVTMDDIDFEVEGLSDDDLVAAFAEHFGNKDFDGEDGTDDTSDGSGDDNTGDEASGSEGETDPDGGDGNPEENPTDPNPSEGGDDDKGDDEEDDGTRIDDDESSKSKRKYSVDENGNMTLTWELSHEDIRNSIYNLMCAESEWWNWIIETYNDSFIYQDGEDGRFYKRGYSIDGDNVALGEDKVQVFSEWLTQEEKDAIAALKADYAKLKEFKDSFDASELKAKKDAIFAREEYAVLGDDEAFAELKENADKYSIDEIEEKAKVIFADYVVKKGQFSLENKGEKKPISKVGINFNKPTKKKAYGNLFND